MSVSNFGNNYLTVHDLGVVKKMQVCQEDQQKTMKIRKNEGSHPKKKCPKLWTLSEQGGGLEVGGPVSEPSKVFFLNICPNLS